MSPTAFVEPADLTELVEPACVLARRWLAPARGESPLFERRAAAQLAGLVRDRDGSDVSIRFVDKVVRPESVTVAARELGRLTEDTSQFLSPVDRALLSSTASLAATAPALVVRLARQRWRQLIGHLVMDTEPANLARRVREARRNGFQLNFNLLGQAVVGERGADERLRGVLDLLAIPGVDHVSIDVADLTPRMAYWDLDGAVDRVVARLRDVFRVAAAKNAFVNLDLAEYRDLDLGLAVFTRLLSEPEFRQVSAGLALQAYLPDSRAALERLIEFAQHRHAAGGAPIKVRLVKGANLALERVESAVQGWALAPFSTKAETDACYLTLIDRAMSQEHGPGFHVGIGTHNLYDIALAYLLARGRGVADRVDIEMSNGWAPAKVRAVRDTVGSVILYSPVVPKDHFELASTYIIQRLEENAQPENFLHAMFGNQLEAAEERFRGAVAAMGTVPTAPHRSPKRPSAFDVDRTSRRFVNTPDSDPHLAEVRAWAAGLVAAEPAPPWSQVLTAAPQVDAVVARGRAAGAIWADRDATERAAALRQAADALEARRGDLVTALVAESGRPVAEADHEVSAAVDCALWYADRAVELATDRFLTDGLTFTPHDLTVVLPAAVSPVACGSSGLFAALAAGSAVVVVPAPGAPRCSEILVEALHAAGINDGGTDIGDVVQVVRGAQPELIHALTGHDHIDAVVVTGPWAAARALIEARVRRSGGHGVIANLAGRNALIITDAADIEESIIDLVASAFGHTGQHGGAASLAILVGEVGASRRFRDQLVDAVTSLRVGWPTDLSVTTGPLATAPKADLARALTTLDPGESWLIEPTPLDDSGRLWSPGVRVGVQPGSWFHRTPVLGPVLGIMRARSLDEAIRWQHDTTVAVSGGLHSLDSEEVAHWLARVGVGNAYVNRDTTGTIIGRQPFGGGKGCVGAKVGGPDYVQQFGQWTEVAPPVRGVRIDDELGHTLGVFTSLVTEPEDRAWLQAAAESDALAWRDVLRPDLVLADLGVQENILRRVPAALTVRGLAESRLVEVLRVVLAARRVGAPLALSIAPEAPYATQLGGHILRCEVRLETDAAFADRFDGERVRVVGPPVQSAQVANRLSCAGVVALGGRVLANGRRELLSVLREQSISRTCHRHGHLQR
ncbi:MAG: bifunctional proline dehydrogenase/L-glutamate gamma-semialdehyde dehydrogenase [Propionibacteriaceae bacterium]|nr:bifunctional proline dehydrogenase/L-glutamate gamma-semialdehyde dehydrogenase [Propionibacteriaceae bacterium]